MTKPTACRATLRATLLSSLAAVALLSAGPALAEPPHDLSIAAGPLEGALLSLAKQTGQQLLFSPGAVAHLRAPALSGRYTAEQALARLLTSTGIEVTRAGPTTLVLRSRAAPAPHAGVVPAAGPTQGESRPFGDGAAAISTAAPPAQSSAPGVRQSENTVAAVEVTGTLLRGVGAGPSPLLVIGREELERSGHATLSAALNVLPQNYSGENTEGATTTRADRQGVNTSFATGVNLRGLGSDSTLVLVNGRRLGGSGGNGDFADLSTLPTIAVSRVEVLLDGASATYGSDAVGGVVNVILRRDLNGGEVRLRAGTGDKGPNEIQLGLVFGHTWRTGGVLIGYEAYRREALAAADRDYTASADLRRYGGADRRLTTAYPGNVVRTDPATGVTSAFFGIPPGQNGVGLTPGSFLPGVVNRTSPQEGIDILPDQRRQSLYLTARQELTPQLEISADLRYGFRRAKVRSAGQTATLTVSRANPFFVSPNGAATNQVQYSFIGELPNPIGHRSAESGAASLGARLQLPHEWIADGYAAFAQEINEGFTSGSLNTAILAEALGNVADRPTTAYNAARDGFFNPYTGIPSNPLSVTSAIGSGFASFRSHSEVRTLNVQADGPLFRLRGGAVRLALGANVRREDFVRQGSNYLSTVAPTPQVRTDEDRTVAAAFVEARIPLVGEANRRPGIEALELSAAARLEHYSDFGRTLNPKVGLTWTVVPDLKLRGTYGESFRAPALIELSDPPLYSPVNFTLGAGRLLSLALQGGNRDLEPETAKSWTLGFDFAPGWTKGLRISATWFDTDFRNRIDRPVTQNLLGALTDPRFTPFVRRISPATNAEDLALITALLADPAAAAAQGLNPPTAYGAIVDARIVNTGRLHVRGLDAQLNYSLEAFGGELRLGANATRLFGYDQALTPATAAINLAGTTTYPVKWRSRLTADWTKGAMSLGGAANYTGGSRDSLGARVEDLLTFDLQARLAPTGGRLEGASLTLSVRNLFDKDPPFYDNPFGFAYDPANADPIGRFFAVQLTRRW